ncbi:hypothetical protein GobsT_63840 [Gemmata obscuriglobus]|uniref:hypothetical protein n=1 Tax=Gemmata obscuriglobus TaxID=114 RepID=UPI0011CD16FB|nr:hypothetical protein [Gemmata obscuriglobus]QEG31562.1 hypothetical protein GobsT_63840 [Gemmata obscuriglobus]VTS10904.1 unnamed protein product [Gemmata obscuriglobus UQM 2246]
MYVVACAVVVLVAVPNVRENRELEELWVREVATHFLDAALAENFKEALASATGEFRQRLKQSSKLFYPEDEFSGLKQVIWPATWKAGLADAGAYPVARRSQLSPAGDEARVTGKILIGQRGSRKAIAQFSTTLNKQTDGKWRVNGLTVQTFKTTGAP